MEPTFEDSMQGNPYYRPESFKLTYLGEVNVADPYMYDTLALWYASDGQWAWAHERGNSCPLPFENLKESGLSRGSLVQFETELAQHVHEGESRYDNPHGGTRALDLASRAREHQRKLAAPKLSAHAAATSKVVYSSSTPREFSN